MLSALEVKCSMISCNSLQFEHCGNLPVVFSRDLALDVRRAHID